MTPTYSRCTADQSDGIVKQDHYDEGDEDDEDEYEK